MSRSRALLLLGAASIATAISCKPKPPEVVLKRPDGSEVEPPTPVSEADEAAATALAKAAADLTAAGDTAGARAKLDELVERYAGTGAGAAELEARGDAAVEEGRSADAIAAYERLLFYRPSHPSAGRVRRVYAQLLILAHRYEDAASLLRALFAAPSGPADKLELGRLLSETLESAGRGREALEVEVELYNDPQLDQAARQEAGRKALDRVAGALSFSDADALWDDVKSDGDWAVVQPALGFKLAKIYYHTREYERSEDLLEEVVSRWGTSEYGKAAHDFLERLRARFQVKSNVIGVVLPLSGKFQQYGERSLAAIKLALKGMPYQIVAKDSQGDPNIAAQVVEELVMNDHVMAIIGELFSKSAMAAALKAEELSVPMLSLSHQEGLPQLGPYVFRTALTVDAQAQALARLAFEELGMTRFALLYPSSKYGIDFANAFWNEVDARQGEIRGAESYEHDQTTFREEVRKLVGRWFLMSRPEYFEKMREIKRANLPPHKEKKQLEELEKATPPIVDFDAIVIPDSGRNIGLIVPALLVEDIVLTRDPKELKTIEKALGQKDLRPTTLLGASTWNTPQTVESCEKQCEHAVFVDGYFPDNPDPKVRDFVSAFKEATGAVPLLSEAQAYDTAALLAAVLATNPADRKTLRERLEKVSTFQGVTGPLRFDKDGEAQRALFNLTIREREIRLWAKPTEPPQG